MFIFKEKKTTTKTYRLLQELKIANKYHLHIEKKTTKKQQHITENK